VGHFIGSPGMNFLPGKVDGSGVHLCGVNVGLPLTGAQLPTGDITLGIRPEYVAVVSPNTPGALPMTVSQIRDVGTHLIISATISGHAFKVRLQTTAVSFAVGEQVWLQVIGDKTCFYQNEEIVQ
jgi:glycerol transport system ATP-binding protein